MKAQSIAPARTIERAADLVNGVASRRIAIYLVAAAALIAIIGAAALWSIRGAHEENLERAASHAARVVQFFERQTISRFRYGDSYLKMVRREFLRSASVESVTVLMNDVPLDTALISHITILDAVGTPIFNSGFAIKPGTTAKDRDYFKHARDLDTDSLHVSLPHRGRNSGKLVVRLVRRMQTSDGTFAGVIFAALDAERVTEFFEAQNLGPNSSATLVGNDKRIRARSSYGPVGPGQDISGSRLWTELAQSTTGLYHQTSVVDGITRYYAYRQLSEFPLIVAIGVAADDIAASVDRQSLPTESIALLATLTVILIALTFWREIRASERIEASEARVRAMHADLEVRVRERTAELEAVQAELLRKERLAVLGQLTGTVAHELRNPLSTINTSAAVIARALQDSTPGLQQTFERLRRNVTRCDSIITELLDFTRSHGLSPEVTDIDRWLGETIDEYAELAEMPVEFEPGTFGREIAVDRGRLRQALINLLSNACDAVREHDGDTRVRVSSSSVGDRIEIVVEDNGPGIPNEVLEKVHEPLFSTKSFGIGLGLPIVDRIATEHGGSLELDSRAGEGTRAILRLPISRTRGDSS